MRFSINHSCLEVPDRTDIILLSQLFFTFFFIESLRKTKQTIAFNTIKSNISKIPDEFSARELLKRIVIRRALELLGCLHTFVQPKRRQKI